MEAKKSLCPFWRVKINTKEKINFFTWLVCHKLLLIQCMAASYIYFFVVHCLKHGTSKHYKSNQRKDILVAKWGIRMLKFNSSFIILCESMQFSCLCSYIVSPKGDTGTHCESRISCELLVYFLSQLLSMTYETITIL